MREQESHAKWALEQAHLRRHERYDERAETLSTRRVKIALRSLHNSKQLDHVPAVVGCIEHRDDNVVQEAMNALGEMRDVNAEEALVVGLSSQLERLIATPGTHLRNAGNAPELATKALESLESWSELGPTVPRREATRDHANAMRCRSATLLRC